MRFTFTFDPKKKTAMLRTAIVAILATLALCQDDVHHENLLAFASLTPEQVSWTYERLDDPGFAKLVVETNGAPIRFLSKYGGGGIPPHFSQPLQNVNFQNYLAQGQNFRNRRDTNVRFSVGEGLIRREYPEFFNRFHNFVSSRRNRDVNNPTHRRRRDTNVKITVGEGRINREYPEFFTRFHNFVNSRRSREVSETHRRTRRDTDLKITVREGGLRSEHPEFFERFHNFVNSRSARATNNNFPNQNVFLSQIPATQQFTTNTGNGRQTIVFLNQEQLKSLQNPQVNRRYEGNVFLNTFHDNQQQKQAEEAQIARRNQETANRLENNVFLKTFQSIPDVTATAPAKPPLNTFIDVPIQTNIANKPAPVHSNLFINQATPVQSNIFINKPTPVQPNIFINEPTPVHTNVFLNKPKPVQPNIFINNPTPIQPNMFINKPTSIQPNVFINNPTPVQPNMFINNPTQVQPNIFINNPTPVQPNSFTNKPTPIQPNIFVNKPAQPKQTFRGVIEVSPFKAAEVMITEQPKMTFAQAAGIPVSQLLRPAAQAPSVQAQHRRGEKNNEQKAIPIFRTPAIRQPSLNALKNLQQAEEDFKTSAQNAMYAFETNIDDPDSKLKNQRVEIRDGNTVRGMYSFSDGFYMRTVHYEADGMGFRIVKEDVVKLPEEN